jgi:BirA family transcriptional regulator, biotin operon repressor / biotin---[acetyl-CoA-carboxylase] ligase
MDDARSLAESGCPAGTVAAAGFQENGRGRVPGRSWLSVAGESLSATVVLWTAEMGFPLEQLTLRAGLAAALGIEDAAGIPARIKWPNDVLADIPGAAEPRKIAGLLCEARGATALVGIGVNCGQRSFPPQIASTAGSLLQACGRALPPPVVLAAILERLRASAETPAWRDQLRARLYLRGQMVRLDLLGSGSTAEGILIDVGDDGGLVLELSDGRRRTVLQGELRSFP